MGVFLQEQRRDVETERTVSANIIVVRAVIMEG